MEKSWVITLLLVFLSVEGGLSSPCVCMNTSQVLVSLKNHMERLVFRKVHHSGVFSQPPSCYGCTCLRDCWVGCAGCTWKAAPKSRVPCCSQRGGCVWFLVEKGFIHFLWPSKAIRLCVAASRMSSHSSESLWHEQVAIWPGGFLGWHHWEVQE